MSCIHVYHFGIGLIETFLIGYFKYLYSVFKSSMFSAMVCCRVLGRILSLNVYVWVLAFGGSKEVKKTLSLSVHHLIILPGICLGDLLTD